MACIDIVAAIANVPRNMNSLVNVRTLATTACLEAWRIDVPTMRNVWNMQVNVNMRSAKAISSWIGTMLSEFMKTSTSTSAKMKIRTMKTNSIDRVYL
jgi:hypothetical protein